MIKEDEQMPNIIALHEISVAKLVDFWMQTIGDEFPMSEALFQQNTLLDEMLDSENSFAVVNEQAEIEGIIATKVNPDNITIAWLHFLMVGQEARGKGIGTKMLTMVEENLRQKGVKKLFLGRDMQHYFPGIPIEDQRTNAWFTAKGFERFETEYDLIHTYDETSETSLPQTENIHYGFLEKAELNTLLVFMEKEFPGRWTEELQAYIKAGGDGREFVVAKKEGKIIGFCRINDKQSVIIAPNMYWHALVQGEPGGIGPLGIASSERGHGYGLAIVEAGIAMLRERAIETIMIDWTGLVDFYGKLGYQPWKTYHAYRKNLI